MATTKAEAIAKTLSMAARNMLCDHVGKGSVPILRGDQVHTQVQKALIARRLVRTEPVNTNAPKRTVLNELGREVAAVVLAEFAEALVRAGGLQKISENLERRADRAA